MTRQIISQDPASSEAVLASDFNDVLMTNFRAHTDEDGTRVSVSLFPYNYADNKLAPKGVGTPMFLDLEDFDNQVSQSPKMERAWNDINDIMGLAYDFYRLREKVKEALANGEDASALITARDLALAELRAPLV